MLTMKIASAIRYMRSGSLAALIRSGTAANMAISMPIKWVTALPGSLILNGFFIEHATFPVYHCSID